MNISLLITCVIAVGFLWFAIVAYKNALKGDLNPEGELIHYLNTLLKECDHKSTLVFEHKDTGFFLQFRKLILDSGEVSIELGFPNAEWNKGYFTLMEQFCIDRKIVYKIQNLYGPFEMEFLLVDFKDDINRAFSTTLEIFHTIYDIEPDGEYYGILEMGSNLPNIKKY